MFPSTDAAFPFCTAIATSIDILVLILYLVEV